MSTKTESKYGVNEMGAVTFFWILIEFHSFIIFNRKLKIKRNLKAII